LPEGEGLRGRPRAQKSPGKRARGLGVLSLLSTRNPKPATKPPSPDKQHLPITRQRPEVVGDDRLELVRHLAHREHLRDDVVAVVPGVVDELAVVLMADRALELLDRRLELTDQAGDLRERAGVAVAAGGLERRG